MAVQWDGLKNLNAKNFTCGYCSNKVASNQGWARVKSLGGNGRSIDATLYICPFCSGPTYFNGNGQIPGPTAGESVNNVPKIVNYLYEEARKAYSNSLYTSVVLCCRKILMNIAVDKGEPAGQTFAKYIDFLETNHYTPPNSKDWVDMIRKKGNEATHEIHETPQAEALEILGFVEMLLKFIFEFPAKVALPVTPIP